MKIEDTWGGFGRELHVDGQRVHFVSLPAFMAETGGCDRLPVSLRILLENLLRHGDDEGVATLVAGRTGGKRAGRDEVSFRPHRVLMHDTTGTPTLVDLVAMRTVLADRGFDPALVDPVRSMVITVCHSNAVDAFASESALAENLRAEFERNHERYAFFRWAQQAFASLSVVPPGGGICHQVNLEHLAEIVLAESDGSRLVVFPDTLVGTDSHTPMINALGILGWGVGGLEGEAVALGRSIRMVIPRVIGVTLRGEPPRGTTATDLALKLTELFRAKGVVGAFIEFRGEGLRHLSLADRATISNMAPEYGATVTLFPVDKRTLAFLGGTGRDPWRVRLVEAYAKEQGLWHDPDGAAPTFDETIEVDLGGLERAVSGPVLPEAWNPVVEVAARATRAVVRRRPRRGGRVPGTDHRLADGDVVIAAVTSCTNAGNPYLLAGAGLLARAAAQRGLRPKAWVKTSLVPASPALGAFLSLSGLQRDLDALGFHVTGFGCTTCVGNSGALPGPIRAAAAEGEVVTTAVLSGNRNFDGRIHPDVRASFLASPAMVVAYAIAGTFRWDPLREPLGRDGEGRDVFLADVWPDEAAARALVERHLTQDLYRAARSHLFTGGAEWTRLPAGTGPIFAWNPDSDYLRFPGYLRDIDLGDPAFRPITGARALVVAGDDVTTDHISPAGAIPADGVAGRYLRGRGVAEAAFNVFAARRGDSEVMVRGAFAHPRLENALAPGDGGRTTHLPSGERLGIYEAALRYHREGVPLVVVAGRNYGCGSSRDWGAKGPAMLGVRAVLARSFERIHRENLVCMGILPIEVPDGFASLIRGDESFDLAGPDGPPAPHAAVTVVVRPERGRTIEVAATCRVETLEETECIRHGGILPLMLREIAATASVGTDSDGKSMQEERLNTGGKY